MTSVLWLTLDPWARFSNLDRFAKSRSPRGRWRGRQSSETTENVDELDPLGEPCDKRRRMYCMSVKHHQTSSMKMFVWSNLRRSKLWLFRSFSGRSHRCRLFWRSFFCIPWNILFNLRHNSDDYNEFQSNGWPMVTPCFRITKKVNSVCVCV